MKQFRRVMKMSMRVNSNMGRKQISVRCEIGKIFGLFLVLIILYSGVPCWAGDTDTIIIPISNLIKRDKTLEGHSGLVYSTAFSPDGRTLASGGGDDTIILWNVATGNKIKTLSNSNDSGWSPSIAFSSDGSTLASGERNTIILWNVATGNKIKTLKGHKGSVHSIAFSPDGRTLASGIDEDETITLWNVAIGNMIKTLKGHSDGVHSIAFSPDGRILASGDRDETIILWDVATGSKIKTLKGHSNGVRSIAFSPDGRILASGDGYGTITLWDVATGNKIKTLEGRGSIYAYSIAFSPDGRTLASGIFGEGTITLYDVATGSKIKTLKGHSQWVYSVAFSPDGRTLASGIDKSIILWDTFGIYLTSSESENAISLIEGERDKKLESLFLPKEEFETSKEYEERIKIAKSKETRINEEYDVKIKEAKDKEEIKLKEKRAKLYPYSFDVNLGKYDADKEGFEAEFLGYKVFISVPREKAMKINQHSDKVNIQGMLKYFDDAKAELTNAFLVDKVSNERFAFGRHTEEVMIASKTKNPPLLTISFISLSEPSDNGILDAGETGKIKVTLKNNGKGSGFGVSLNLSTSEGGLLLKGINFNEKTYIGTINPDEEKTVEIDIRALEDIQTADVKFRAIALESNGFDSKPVILAFKTKELIPPLLQIETAEKPWHWVCINKAN